ncbi:MAG: VCBS repeat-containing protein [Deltaproteobacteria bacterium]|nr:VCBS repeat-containing protein [Deltaproteobacteria bacterium]
MKYFKFIFFMLIATFIFGCAAQQEVIHKKPEKEAKKVKRSYPFDLYKVDKIPRGLTAADLNNDGYLDLISTNHRGDSIDILLNNKMGKFSLFLKKKVPFHPNESASADLDGDGFNDIVVVSEGEDRAVIFKNQKGVDFVEVKSVSLPSSTSYSVVSYDLNGDKKPDLITGSLNGNSISVLINKGNFKFKEELIPSGLASLHPVVSDIDKDSIPEIIVANHFSDDIRIFKQKKSPFKYELFKKIALPHLDGLRPRPRVVKVADMDGDGIMDLICTMELSGKVLILFGDKEGNYTKNAVLAPGNVTWSMDVGDLNNDGKLEIVVARFAKVSMLHVYMNKGNGRDFIEKKFVTKVQPFAVHISDLDKNGYNDIAFVHYYDSEVAVFLNPYKSFK